MSLAVDHWKAVYEPMLNQRLNWMWFYPLVGGDTPEVVRDLQASVIGFSGAVRLQFGDHPDLYLTWNQVGEDCGLYSSRDENGGWSCESVDRIRMSAEDPWGKLCGGWLEKVVMYSSRGFDERPIITTAAHHLDTKVGRSVLWVSTASGAFAGAGDDLLVTVDGDLADSDGFELQVTIQ